MSEKRWKVIKNGGAFPPGAILTLRNEATVGYPYMQGKDGAASNIGIDRLVEIDADGNTVRTYKIGDTLDGGTLVQREEKMEGLDEYKVRCARCGELKPLPFRRDEMGGYVCNTCIDHELDNLAAEVQRLRDKLAAVHDVWVDVPAHITRIKIMSGDIKTRWQEWATYTREPPKTIEQEIAEKYATIDGGFTDGAVVSMITSAIAEYKARTGQTS